jgi:hypothetical protein
MTEVLSEMQFDLDGFVFGNGRDVFIDEKGFDPGDWQPTTQEGVNPITGARIFGRDTDSPATWTFACHVNREDTVTALASLAAMGAKWKSSKWRATGAVAMMRYCLGGRTRVVFGRPRRFSAKPDNLILGGYLPPLATFDLVDSNTYDEVEQFVDMQLAPSVIGGFATPFEAPLTIEQEADSFQPGAMVLGGDTEAGYAVDFFGPVTNPSVVIGNSTIGLTGTIPAGQSVTVDTRPWSQGMFPSAGARGVTLTAATRLARALVSPGAYQVIFRGTDATGTARCRVRWRNAHSTL